MTAASFAFFDAFDRICIIVPAGGAGQQPATAQALGVAPGDGRVHWVETDAGQAPDGFPTAQARGQFLAHLQALDQARRDGVQRLLMLEADVVFVPELAGFGTLTRVLQGGNWHLAYLGHELPPQDGPVDWVCSGEVLEASRCYAVAASALPTVTVHLQNCLLRPPGHPEGGPMPVGAALSLLRQLEPALVTIRASRSLAERRGRKALAADAAARHRPGVGARMLAGVRAGWRRLYGAP